MKSTLINTINTTLSEEDILLRRLLTKRWRFSLIIVHFINIELDLDSVKQDSPISVAGVNFFIFF